MKSKLNSADEVEKLAAESYFLKYVNSGFMEDGKKFCVNRLRLPTSDSIIKGETVSTENFVNHIGISCIWSGFENFVPATTDNRLDLIWFGIAFLTGIPVDVAGVGAEMNRGSGCVIVRSNYRLKGAEGTDLDGLFCGPMNIGLNVGKEDIGLFSTPAGTINGVLDTDIFATGTSSAGMG